MMADPKKHEYTYTHYSSNNIPYDVLKSCANIFSNHYGVWDIKSKLT